MSESRPVPITISFECPVCKRTVEMTNSRQHNLSNHGENHSRTATWDDDYDCLMFFGDEERRIRRKYDFIRYEMPPIFTKVPENVTDQETFLDVIDGTVTHQLGVTIEVTKKDTDGNVVGTGYVHGWYHDNKPSYYAVTTNLRTPQNVIVTESRSEFAEFLERWYYHNREYEKPDDEYRDYEPETENQSLEDF